MFGNGYKDTVQKDGLWRIISNGRPYDGPGFALDMALYRAAELTVASGHKYFQVIDGNMTVGVGLYVRGRESIKMIVRPSDDASPPPDCRLSRPENCFTKNAEDILKQIGPTLKK